MKIATIDFFANPGGVVSVLRNLLPELSKHGHEVTFIDPLPKSFNKDFNIQNVALEVYPNWPIIKDKNIVVYTFRIITTAVGYFFYAIRLGIWLKYHKYDTIYVHLKKGIVLGGIVSKLTGIPLVVHSHGFNNIRKIDKYYAYFLRQADRIIAVSDDVKLVLTSSGVDESKITVIYNGLDMNLWKSDLVESNKSSGQIILFVGAIQKNKGLHILIEALSLLKLSDIGFELWIIGEVPIGGDTNYYGELARMAKALGLTDSIKFMGQRTDIAAILPMGRVLVLPSIIEESFGMVIAEAGASGTLAIGSSLGGIPEVLGDPELTFIPENPISLAAVLEKVLTDDLWANDKRATFYEYVISNFTLQKQAEQVGKILSELRGNQ